MSSEGTAAAAPLALIFATNAAFLTRGFEGVTDDQLWLRPSEHNNPILWIAGHIVGTRARILQLLGDDYDTGWGAIFARGAVLGADATYPSRDDILRVHGEVAPRLRDRLLSLSAADLAREATAGPTPPGVKTVGEQLGFFALHDSYHIGQVAFIRKALGLSNLAG
jgi:hypothetical protein